ncbi:MT-A70 family methyltransferase [Labrys okinawensis]|uniref:MT-A70 family methyltransferase n=1 Tax=Labrys okinawensis TaxID=346911 RepID=UPI0039BC9829
MTHTGLAIVNPAAELGLVGYDQLCRALAVAATVDEVAKIQDKSKAMQAYAKQARNRGLEADASEVRMRAERKLGEMMDSFRQAGHMSKGGRRPQAETGVSGTLVGWGVSLAEIGINKNLAKAARKASGLDDIAFAQALVNNRERILFRDDRPVFSTAKKQALRADRERVLAGRIKALPKKRYGVIYADPEWRFEPYSRSSGMDRSADNHYPTSCVEAIVARDVPSIAAEDCVLFLWSTAPMLLQALKVMAAWGFAYKSHIIWDKQRPGTGYWARNQHELLLIGTRGHMPAPAPGEQPASILSVPRGEHSAKPAEVRKLIERMFPNVPKVELNRRGSPIPGWDAWGNEFDLASESHKLEDSA